MGSPPRLEIGKWPTPVHRMARSSEELGADVWVKVEERCGAWGGNKVRKLEYILAAAHADGIRRLVSYGVGTSNWAAALVHHATALDLEVVVGLAGPIPPAYQSLYDRAGVTVVHARAVNALPFVVAAARIKAGTAARSVPMGGSGPGDIGSLHVGEEIASDIARGAMPKPDAIYLPAGTTGTAAGVAAGLALEGCAVPVIAVKVAPWPYGTAARARKHARALLRFRAAGERSVRIEGDGRFHAPGYGRSNPESLEAIATARQDGLELDGTYAAKGFAAVIDRARRNRGETLLFIHTSPGPPPPSPRPAPG